eukprot:scaffold4815_cov184-Ochromonas_danica.AAC.6
MANGPVFSPHRENENVSYNSKVVTLNVGRRGCVVVVAPHRLAGHLGTISYFCPSHLALAFMTPYHNLSPPRSAC